MGEEDAIAEEIQVKEANLPEDTSLIQKITSKFKNLTVNEKKEKTGEQSFYDHRKKYILLKSAVSDYSKIQVFPRELSMIIAELFYTLTMGMLYEIKSIIFYFIDLYK